MLRVNRLEAGYGRQQVLHGISLQVPEGKVVALLGGNGSGKTTTLKTIAGLLPVWRGTVELQGKPIQGQPAHHTVRRGLVLVPQGRELFSEMTVQENLELGGVPLADRHAVRQNMQEIMAHFPRLSERTKQRAGSLSGGEQQMLAIGRALMSRPACLMMDEPSAGLAPLLVVEISRIIRSLSRAGRTILLVEQNVGMAMRLADFVYIIRNGQIVFEGDAADLDDSDKIFGAYIG